MDSILIGRDGEQFGPYTHDELKNYVKAGNVLPTDLAWKEGMSDWVTVDQFLLDLGVATSPTREPVNLPKQPVMNWRNNMPDSALATDNSPVVVSVSAQEKAAPHKVSLLFGLGILLAPLIFAWFTLKKGYSIGAKSWAFGWMCVFLLLPVMTVSRQATSATAGGSAVAKLPVPMRLACSADAFPSAWESARLFFNFDPSDTVTLLVASVNDVQVWKWSRTSDGFAMQPVGALKSDGQMIRAADSGKTVYLNGFKRAGTSSEGDTLYEATLGPHASPRRLGCIFINGS